MGESEQEISESSYMKAKEEGFGVKNWIML